MHALILVLSKTSTSYIQDFFEKYLDAGSTTQFY